MRNVPRNIGREQHIAAFGQRSACTEESNRFEGTII